MQAQPIDASPIHNTPALPTHLLPFPSSTAENLVQE